MKNSKKFALLGTNKPLKLDSGKNLKNFKIAYQTYGKLNKKKNNAILICNDISGDQYAAGKNPLTKRPGWWSKAIGPNLPIDTNKFFVICSNVLGGCLGSTGPKEINPNTKKKYNMSFPVITIKDMVNAQKMLIDELGIEKLLSVIGGSAGGFQALQWAANYPEKVVSAIPIATSFRHSAQNIAFHEVGRQAIMSDPDWCNGDYINNKKKPEKGLSVARMLAHITYLSEEAFQRKFGRNLQNKLSLAYGFKTDFQVESYLKHQGQAFVDRFDANSYLYITRAMDYFDLPSQKKGGLENIYKNTPVKFCVISFTSDWVYPTKYSKEIVDSLNNVGANVSFVEIKTDKGHDAFLLDEKEFNETVKGFLKATATKVGF